MKLSKKNLGKIKADNVIIPDESLFGLPEKVLQFGTGVLLRGLPDYFIDKANREGFFNGRIVAVKSTGIDVAEFDARDCLYTLQVIGVENGHSVDERMICAAISRVLAAGKDWDEVLEVARSPHLQVVISNTTEVGITLKADDAVSLMPPDSYPGKLLAVLYERYKAFNGAGDCGLVIIPTELIADNGEKLRAIVLKLAALNQLEVPFISWLENHNHFCNSLVDRIVPGHPPPERRVILEETLGYQDDLSIVAEAYCLWAIAGDEKIKNVLSFYKAHNGVVITPDIALFRELKLRLLNGSHTLCCAVAFLAGFDTVKAAMDDRVFYKFIEQLMYREIIPAMPGDIDTETAGKFAASVLDRFLNPGIAHHWINITVQYSTKMKLRVVPLLLNHYKKKKVPPGCFVLGFAAFIRFMKVGSTGQTGCEGSANGLMYPIKDDHADLFAEAWSNPDLAKVVELILSDTRLWDNNLSLLNGFQTQVTEALLEITTQA